MPKNLEEIRKKARESRERIIASYNSISPEEKRLAELGVFFSNRVSSILNEKGLIQKDLAELMGKTESEISKILSGDHNLTFKTVAKIEISLEENILFRSMPSFNAYQPTYSLSFVPNTLLPGYIFKQTPINFMGTKIPSNSGALNMQRILNQEIPIEEIPTHPFPLGPTRALAA